MAIAGFTTTAAGTATRIGTTIAATTAAGTTTAGMAMIVGMIATTITTMTVTIDRRSLLTKRNGPGASRAFFHARVGLPGRTRMARFCLAPAAALN